MITQAQLKEILHYDPETGAWTWIISPRYEIPAGSIAGGYGNHGYRRIRIRSKFYTGHRLAWLYMTGSFPAGHMDHINGVRDDNRFSNLRIASLQENGLNRQRYITNTSGHKGVCWHPKLGKWRARIQKYGKRVALGCYDTKEEAAAAYEKAAVEHFGEFNRGHQDADYQRAAAKAFIRKRA